MPKAAALYEVVICGPWSTQIALPRALTLLRPCSYDFTDMTSDMQAKEKKQMTLMEICDFMSGAISTILR